MIGTANGRTGRGLRASPRARAQACLGLALLVALAVAACGGSGSPGSAARSEASGAASEDGAGPGSGGAGSGGGATGGARLPDRVGEIDLEAVSYRVPDALDGVGGPQVAAMLEALDLAPTDVTLAMAVDRDGRLDIGRWELPGREADAILAAWKAAAGSGWQPQTLAGEPALMGRGPDGRQAWVVARDGLFLYIVTDDPNLGAEAVAGTP